MYLVDVLNSDLILIVLVAVIDVRHNERDHSREFKRKKVNTARANAAQHGGSEVRERARPSRNTSKLVAEGTRHSGVSRS